MPICSRVLTLHALAGTHQYGVEPAGWPGLSHGQSLPLFWFLQSFPYWLTLPTLVLVSGLISLFGQSRCDGLRTLLPNWSLYGLDGILTRTFTFNLPFAVRVLTLSLDQLPVTRLTTGSDKCV